MVLCKNILYDFPDHVVQMDLPKIESRPIAEFRMEIFVTDQFVQFIISNGDSDYGMAFLIGSHKDRKAQRCAKTLCNLAPSSLSGTKKNNKDKMTTD